MPGSPCPCGLPAPYAACCGRFHHGDAAPTAERLMRSRYAAFVVGDQAYLRRTWHPATRPRRIGLDPDTCWIALEVLAATSDGDAATVEFRAHHDRGATHELSRFVRVDGSWLYVDGDVTGG